MPNKRRSEGEVEGGGVVCTHPAAHLGGVVGLGAVTGMEGGRTGAVGAT